MRATFLDEPSSHCRLRALPAVAPRASVPPSGAPGEPITASESADAPPSSAVCPPEYRPSEIRAVRRAPPRTVEMKGGAREEVAVDLRRDPRHEED